MGPNPSSWDWPFILYAGINWLGYKEEEVWDMTPRKFKALLDVHIYIQEQKYGTGKEDKNTPNTFIDQIPGW